jgi:hypothetical protein
MLRLSRARGTTEQQKLRANGHGISRPTISSRLPLVAAEVLAELSVVSQERQLLRLCAHKAVILKRFLAKRITATKDFLSDARLSGTSASASASTRGGSASRISASHLSEH